MMPPAIAPARFGLRPVLLAPLGLLIVVLIVVSTASVFYLEKQHTAEDAAFAFNTVQEVFESVVRSETQKLSAGIDLIARDEHLIRAMKAGNQAELLRRTQPAFESLRQSYGITHFYLSDADRINRLRVHQPERHGDRIDRATTLNAERSGRPAAGLELGPLGTFTLRAVFPWRDGDRLLGYIELGEEIENVVVDLQRALGVELHFLIDKKLINREEWRIGMQMLGRDARWDFLPDAVMTSGLTSATDTGTIKQITTLVPAVGMTANMDDARQRHLHIMTPALRDITGQTVGRMLVIKDVTARMRDSRRHLIAVATTMIILGGALLAFFHILIGRIEGRLEAAGSATRKALERSQHQLDAIGRLAAAPALISGEVILFSRQVTEETCTALNVEYVGVWLFDEAREHLVCLDHYAAATRDHLPEHALAKVDHRAFFDALQSTRFLSMDDTACDSRVAELAPTYLAPHGIKAMLCAGIHVSGNDVGLLTLGHATTPRQWHGDEIAFACQLADKLALAIMTERRQQIEAERQRLQKQLNQAQKLEAIGQLTGGIAHDFNNMLTTILGYTTLALQRFVPDKQSKLAEYLGHVVTSGERARDLIAKMLAFSRIRTSQPAAPLAPAPLIKEVAKMLIASIPSTIEIRTHIEAEVPNITIEPVELHQLVVNLVINARDAIASEHGSIDIILNGVTLFGGTCSACGDRISGQFVELAVHDSGSGIAPDNITRIFDPFFTTKEVGKGTGMGLSVIHGIMHERKGHILVESDAQGTTMRLLFPMTTSVADKTAGQERPTQAAATPMGRRVLIVDDEPALASYLSELLETHGYLTTTFTSSSEALRCFQDAPRTFDAVVTDQTMPGLTGAQMAETMFKLRPELPIVMVTGFSEHFDEAAALRLGVRAFLHKPIASAQLLDSLHNAIGEAGGIPKETSS